MSDTRNVKLGVCSVTFNGADLGYTKGGVEVEVKTTTAKVEVDQFGNSDINEYIIGRMITAKVPLAETTVTNLNNIMPGSTLASTPGAAAAGSFTFTAVPAVGDTMTIDGLEIKFIANASEPRDGSNEVAVGTSGALTATAVKAFLTASTDSRISLADFAVTTDVLAVTYATAGTEGNAYLLSASSAGITVVAMTGGVDDVDRTDVTNGIGISLLDNAAPLTLHPIANADTDLSEDLTIPLSNTPGSATFAYKLDQERIFNVTFTGYPNPVTKLLFSFGDPAAGT